ncbi:MAG: hypothetical protein IJE48_02895 [Clostridia bacterium]|nr:hypothetical protein [Clostridia bacterium]
MKKNILAIILVFSLLLSFAACRKLDSESIIVQTKVYIVDEEGVTRNVYNVGSDYYYYDEDGNRKEADSNDVVVETNTIKATQPQSLSPEAESFMAQFEDAESIEDMMEVDATQPTLENDQLIPEDAFGDEVDVDVDADGNPVHEDIDLSYEEILAGDKFTMDVNMKVTTGGVETVAPFKFMKNGDDIFFETAMPREDGSGSTRLNFLLLDGNCYIIIPSMRAYMMVPKDDVGESMIPTEALDAFDEIEGTYLQSYMVDIDGKTYLCDVYENGEATTKRYYLDNQLKRIETVSGSDVSIMEFNSVSTSVNEANFKAPTNYIDISTITGSDFMSTVTG